MAVVERVKLLKPSLGPKNKHRLLVDDQVRIIRQRYNKGERINIIAKDTKISWARIKMIVTRVTYKDVI